MKKGIFIILIIMISLNIYSQNILKIESNNNLVRSSKINSYYSIDSTTYIINKYSFLKKEYYLYRDSIIVDTLKSNGKLIFDDYTKNYYFIETNKNYGHLYKFDPNIGKLSLSSDNKYSLSCIYNNKIPNIDSVRLKTSIPILDGYNQLQGYKEIEINFAFQLSILDIQKNKKELLVDFSENIKENFISEIIDFSLFKDQIVFYTGYSEAGGIYNGQYWGVNIKSKKLNKINIPKDYDETYYSIDTKKEHLIIFKENFNTIDAIVFNKKFQNIGKILYRQNTIKGFKINNGVRKGNYYKSFLEDHTQMCILDNLEILREFALFKIYNDEFIENIENLSLDNLNLLKNMVFAKHNYKFDNEYYQAYFNLYNFYSLEEKRKIRTKDVNHLLTKVDKVNLKLINNNIKHLENK